MNDSRNSEASAITYIIVGIVFLFLFVGLLFECFHHEPRRGKCLSNLKQIGLAMKQYALDNDEVFPFGEGIEPYQALGKLHPSYASSLEIFRCDKSHDKKWNPNSAHEMNNKDDAPLRKDTCKTSLSYAYGINKGKPWTEAAQSTTRIAGDKYATEDYSKGDNKKRPSNHDTDGRNVVRLDGSAQWDNKKGKLEADPEWDIRAGMSTDNPQYAKVKDSNPEHDQTGADWWSDPPGK